MKEMCRVDDTKPPSLFTLYAKNAQGLVAPSSQTEVVTPRSPLHFTVSLTLALACVEGMHRAEGTQLTKQRQVPPVLSYCLSHCPGQRHCFFIPNKKTCAPPTPKQSWSHPARHCFFTVSTTLAFASSGQRRCQPVPRVGCNQLTKQRQAPPVRSYCFFSHCPWQMLFKKHMQSWLHLGHQADGSAELLSLTLSVTLAFHK